MLQEVLGGAYSLGLSHELTDEFVCVSVSEGLLL